jgi:hypothetical protein
VKQHLSAEEARVQAAELLRKAKLKREKEEAEIARIREREVRPAAFSSWVVLAAQVLQLVCVGTSVAAIWVYQSIHCRNCGAVDPVIRVCLLRFGIAQRARPQ